MSPGLRPLPCSKYQSRGFNFRSICPKSDRMPSRNVIKSLLNMHTLNSHCAVYPFSSPASLARVDSRLHQLLAHHWHSQISAYLLTHLPLLQLVISNILENDFQQSTSLNVFILLFLCVGGEHQ